MKVGNSYGDKPAHSREKPVQGLARAVELHMGDWKGKVDLTLASMDAFPVVLGIDFLRQVASEGCAHATHEFAMHYRGEDKTPRRRCLQKLGLSFVILNGLTWTCLVLIRSREKITSRSSRSVFRQWIGSGHTGF